MIDCSVSDMCTKMECRKKQVRRRLEVKKAPELLMIGIKRFNLVNGKAKSQNVSMRTSEGFQELGGGQVNSLDMNKFDIGF